MARKHADYEYKVKNGVVRVEKAERELNTFSDETEKGWVWRFFHNNGSFTSSNDQEGDLYKLKRDAKEAGFKYAEMA
jgi:hypothetical protein